MALSDIAGPRISSIKKEFRRKKKGAVTPITMDKIKGVFLETRADVVNHMAAYFEDTFEKHHPGCSQWDDYDLDSYGEYD